jgi:hypothetical protein
MHWVPALPGLHPHLDRQALPAGENECEVIVEVGKSLGTVQLGIDLQ